MNIQINWLKIFLAVAIGLAILAAVSYWQIQNKTIDAEEIAPGCIVRFLPSGESEIIPFGDPRCP